jgi:ribonuclease T2
MKYAGIACGVLCMMLNIAVDVHAKPSCSVKSQKKVFRLELSVPATFCKGSKGADPSCEVFPKVSVLQLHGLWPNYASKGYPSGACDPQSECQEQPANLGKYCKYPEPPALYASEGWKKLGDYMAGKEKCLERHEWVKHGTCTEMAATEYFDWALGKTKEISDKLALEPDKEISRKEFNQRVKEKLPAMDGAIHLGCKGKRVSNVYVIYEWGKEPGAPVKTASGQNAMGNCGNTFVFPSKP